MVACLKNKQKEKHKTNNRHRIILTDSDIADCHFIAPQFSSYLLNFGSSSQRLDSSWIIVGLEPGCLVLGLSMPWFA